MRAARKAEDGDLFSLLPAARPPEDELTEATRAVLGGWVLNEVLDRESEAAVDWLAYREDQGTATIGCAGGFEYRLGRAGVVRDEAELAYLRSGAQRRHGPWALSRNTQIRRLIQGDTKRVPPNEGICFYPWIDLVTRAHELADDVDAVGADVIAQEQANRLAEYQRRTRVMSDGTEVFWTPSWTATWSRYGPRPGSPQPGVRCWLCGAIELDDHQLHGQHGVDWRWPYDLDRAACMQQLRVAASWEGALAEDAARQARAAEAPRRRNRTEESWMSTQRMAEESSTSTPSNQARLPALSEGQLLIGGVPRSGKSSPHGRWDPSDTPWPLEESRQE